MPNLPSACTDSAFIAPRGTIINQKLKLKHVKSKVGSLDNKDHQPQGGEKKIKHDPLYLEKLRSMARSISSKPGHMQKMLEASLKAETWRIGQAAMTPESYAKAGRTLSAKCLAWCPPELRDEYRRLTASKKIPAKQARAMILEQHEKAMAEFRRKLGAA